MFIKRLKGLLAMVLAGSLAVTSLPLSASATIDCSVDIYNANGDYSSISATDIVSDGNGGYTFSDTALSGNADLKNNLTVNNLWVIYGKYYDGDADNTFLETVAGNEIAQKLNDYKEDSSKRFYNNVYGYFIFANPYHNVLLTTKDLSVGGVTNNDLTSVTVSTFPYDLSTYLSTVDVGPLMEFTETSTWTAWYNTNSGSVSTDYIYNSGNCTKITDTPENITEKVSADIVGKVYESSSAYDAFSYGKTVIQLNADYKTFKIPVYDGMGLPTDDVITVTYGNTEALIPETATAALKGVYLLVYEKDSEHISTSGWIHDKADLWAAVEDVAVEYSEFDASKAKLVRDVTYKVYESAKDGKKNQGEFTSLDLLNGVTTNTGKQYLDSHSASSDNIWKVTSSHDYVAYTDDVNADITDILTNSDAYTITLTNMANIAVTAETPVVDTKILNTDVYDYPVSKYPAATDSIAAYLTGKKNPTAGYKYDTDNWTLWDFGAECGAVIKNNIPVSDKSEIGIDDYNNIVYPYTTELLVYFPEIEIAPDITVTAPAAGETPAAIDDISVTDDCSVTAVSWSVGDTALTSGEKFKVGKQYTVSVTLTPGNGLAFTADTKATVNETAAQTALNTDDGTLTITYTFPEIPLNAISAAQVTVTAPALGETPSTTVSVEDGANYEAEFIGWTPADSTFKGDTAYSAEIKLTAKEEYEFTANTTAAVNGNAAAVVLNNDGTLTVNYEFAAIQLNAIPTAELTVTAPALGAAPATTAAVPANAAYTAEIVGWTPAVTAFAADTKYTVTAKLTPAFGSKFTANTTAAVNGNAAAVVLNNDGTLTVTYEFAAIQLNAIPAAALTVTAPALGAAPATTAAVPANAAYTAELVGWSPAVTAFAADTKYTVTAKLTPAFGSKFTANTTATVNGNAAAVVLNSDGTLTVNYEFAAIQLNAIPAAALTVTAPALGAAPATTVAVPANAAYTAEIVGWSPAVTAFAADTKYTVTAKLTPAFGSKFTANTTAAVNGNAAAAVLNSDGTLTVNYEFAKIELDAIPTAEITVTAPALGAAPATTVAVPANAAYTAELVGWSPAVTEFAADIKYTVTVKFTPAFGSKFSANTIAAVNGNTAAVTLNNDGTLTASYEFGELSIWDNLDNELIKDRPIIKVPKGKIIPKDVLKKIKASGKPVELDFGDYSWIIGPYFDPDFELDDIDLNVITVPESDWATVVNNVTGHKYRMQISIAHTGPFGFTAVLMVDLSEGMVGAPDGTYYANLYQILGDKLEWNASSVLTQNEDGKWMAALTFEHASEWLITIDNEDKNPANINDDEDDQPTHSWPNGPSAPGNNKKYAQTSKSVGWTKITTEINSSVDGSTIEITLNDDTTIPEDTIRAAINKKAKLIIDAGYGRKWTIDGTNAVPGSINLTVSGVNVNIPEDSTKDIACKGSMQLKVNASALGFTAQLSAFAGADKAGQKAAVYLYNENTGKLEFKSMCQVDNSGSVNFNVTTGGRYFIAMGDNVEELGNLLLGDVNNDGTISAADASDILKSVVGTTTVDNEVADVNGDGKTGASDASLVLQYVVGMIDSFR